MRIGVMGLGKVGLPLAQVLMHHGHHQVIGYDPAWPEGGVDPDDQRMFPEPALRELLRDRVVPVAPSVEAMVNHSDVIMIIVPTPHPRQHDPTTEPAPFQLGPLKTAIRQVAAVGQPIRIIVVSTINPGDFASLFDGLDPKVVAAHSSAYSPVFISLGRVVADLVTPPFVLAGVYNDATYECVRNIWTPVWNACPVVLCTPADAEIAKLAVNVVRGSQIALSNAFARMCDTYGADVDLVTQVLNHVPRVFGHDWPRAGLSDGGACRPRDLRAMAAAVSYSRPTLYQALAEDAHLHASWLASIVERYAWGMRKAPVILLGTAYRADIPYEDGSPARTLQWYLEHQGGLEVHVHDPLTGAGWPPPTQHAPAVYVLAVPHQETLVWLASTPSPLLAGSVIIDPLGLLPNVDGYFRNVALYQPGRDRLRLNGRGE